MTAWVNVSSYILSNISLLDLPVGAKKPLFVYEYILIN